MGSDDDGGRKVKSSNTCEWSPDAVFSLLDRYGEKYVLGNGFLRNKDWEEVVECVNSHSEAHKCPKTLKQCRDKVDSLKKRYKMEKRRIVGLGATSTSWPFFAKLNEIIESVPMTSRVRDFTRKQVRGASNGGSTGYTAAPTKDEDADSSNGKEEEEQEEGSPSAGDSPTDNANGDGGQEEEGKASEEDLEDSSEEALESPSPSEKAQVPLDNGGCKKKLEQLSESMFKLLAEKRRQLSSHPVQALADAIVGFSDVYARIELAKLEIYTNMQIEIAKVERGRKRKRKTVPSSSSNSDSG